MDTIELLKVLSEASGLSGSEDAVMAIVQKELEPYVDDIEIDGMGNLIAWKDGTDVQATTVMLAAHADEVGLMVKSIDEKGFISFMAIGGLFSQTVLNQRVLVQAPSGPVLGVIGSKAPHLMKAEEHKQVVELSTMFIDIGCDSKEEVEELGIEAGTAITFEQSFEMLKGDLVTGKALDNRVGLVVMIQAIKALNETPYNLYAVATVQEEVGLKGARVAAFDVVPDVAIALDVTIPGDHPGVTLHDASVVLGKGPAIIVADGGGRGLIANKQVVAWLRDAGRVADVPYQLEASDGGTTDGMAMQLTRRGVATGVLSVPCRYLHSPCEVVNIRDVEQTIALLIQALESDMA